MSGRKIAFIGGGNMAAGALIFMKPSLIYHVYWCAHKSVALMLLPLLGVGLGIGLCWPHLLTHIYRAAPEGQEEAVCAARP